MLEIEFAGWFECRLATDPDAYNHPRGQFGWTFAMPGEPDLDRIIRFQEPTAPRSHCPQVGVRVTNVRVGGISAEKHPLLSVPVELLENAVFEGRNGEIATSAQEPIVPFELRVQAGEISLVGRDAIDLSNTDEIVRRQPVSFVGVSADVAEATGIMDRPGYRQQRRTLLQQDLASETDPIRQAALQKRIEELGKGSIRVTSLGFQLVYEFALRGPNDWSDPGGQLGPAPAPNAIWQMHFWMGGWDADALSGYVKGSLNIG